MELAEALIITAEHPFPALPDPDDEAIIASALAGQAEVFITGDKALLELQRIEKLPVMSPRQFWEVLAAKGGVDSGLLSKEMKEERI